MVKLELEITEEMQKELEGICQEGLLPIEHVARNILANAIYNQKRRVKSQCFLGFPVEKWVNALNMAIAVLVQKTEGGEAEAAPHE